MPITIDKRYREQGHRQVSPFVPPPGGGASMIDVKATTIAAPGTLAKRAP